MTTSDLPFAREAQFIAGLLAVLQRQIRQTSRQIESQMESMPAGAERERLAALNLALTWPLGEIGASLGSLSHFGYMFDKSGERLPAPASDLERINATLVIIARLGGFDEAQHKQHALDMTVRALTGCPEVEHTAVDANGTPYTFTTLGENEAYRAWVAAFEAGDDGSRAYRWETGQPA